MNNRYKNITKPLVVIAIIFLVLSVFARSSFRWVSHSGNRGYINRCNQKMSGAEAKIEEKMSGAEAKIEEKMSGAEAIIEEKAASFEEKMDRAADKIDEKFENIFD